MRNTLKRVRWVAVYLLLVSGLVQAQVAGSTATISGSVVDPSGKAVREAAVTIKNDLSGASRSARVRLGRPTDPASRSMIPRRRRASRPYGLTGASDGR